MKTNVLSLAVATVMLAACGDSDLPEHHQELLADERLEREAAEIGAALPAEGGSTGAETNTAVEPDSLDGSEEDHPGPGEDDSVDSETTAIVLPEGGEEELAEEELAEEELAEEELAEEELAEEELAEEELAEEELAEEQSTSSVTSPDLENDFTLVFSDEFDGSSLDFTRWKSALEWGPDLIVNEEQQYYVDTETSPGFGYNPFSFDGDNITISAIPTPEALDANANGQPYLSGVLSTATRFDMQYGYVEARMDLPTGTGLWPSFWMLSSDYNETTLRPRVFISEFNGGRPGSIFHNYQYEDEDGAVRSPGQFRVDDDTLSDGFHTIGLSWTPEDLVYYIDGTPRYRVIGDRIPQQAMYLILNLAVGGVWVSEPDESTPNPAELVVDYVRVYERNGG